MTDVGEFMRVYLRGLCSISPTDDDEQENAIRFRALIDLAEHAMKLAKQYTGEQDVDTFQSLLRIGLTAEQLWPRYRHSADELGD